MKQVMFELSVAFKYLIPRKKQISVSLIALLSVFVISLVVWLVLVFLSVTEGIEKSWLQKLTTLNAPLRITPTADYYGSYYYQIDEFSGNSEYRPKNISQKQQSPWTDPFDSALDGQPSFRLPPPDCDAQGLLKDPVKGLLFALDALKKTHPDLIYQDFELSGALLRLQLLRPDSNFQASQGYLTQVSYVASLPDKCPFLPSLLLSPTLKDLNHLFYLCNYAVDLSRQDAPMLTLKAEKSVVQKRIHELFKDVTIQELKSSRSLWQMPFSLLPQKERFEAFAHFHEGRLSHLTLPLSLKKGVPPNCQITLHKEGSELIIEDTHESKKIPSNTPLFVEGGISFAVEEIKDSLLFKAKSLLQGIPIYGNIDSEGLEIAQAKFNSKGWFSLGAQFVNQENETGILLAKSYQENGVMVGDRGYLSYSSSSSSALQEHRLPIFVMGFYDPGIFSVGNKCILAPPFVTQTINASSSSFNLDKTQANGILVWFNDLVSAERIKQQILAHLEKLELSKYWTVRTFHEYDFAKDLMQQFQSDKYLFAMVGTIILIVACCNIISMLVLLVNDKKKEIGILQAMGASRFSIAFIFGICGIAMGILSSFAGTLAALYTVQHIDSIVQLLSYLQGHDAFNSNFFGNSLPKELSRNAVIFVGITTPLISLLAGLIPAIKACRLKPCEILRSD